MAAITKSSDHSNIISGGKKKNHKFVSTKTHINYASHSGNGGLRTSSTTAPKSSSSPATNNLIINHRKRTEKMISMMKKQQQQQQQQQQLLQQQENNNNNNKGTAAATTTIASTSSPSTVMLRMVNNNLVNSCSGVGGNSASSGGSGELNASGNGIIEQEKSVIGGDVMNANRNNSTTINEKGGGAGGNSNSGQKTGLKQINGKRTAAAASNHQNGSNNVATTIVEDDNRKKRCSDRYDSSESSDSGVATLSCTDTTSSDTSDPGSPYSPLSLEETVQSAGSGSVGSLINNSQNHCNITSMPAAVTAIRQVIKSDAALLPPTTTSHTAIQLSARLAPSLNGSSTMGAQPLPPISRITGSHAQKLFFQQWSHNATDKNCTIMPKLAVPISTDKGVASNLLLATMPAAMTSCTNTAILQHHSGTKAMIGDARPQTKITGFFKSQMKQPVAATTPPTPITIQPIVAPVQTIPVAAAATTPMAATPIKKDITNLAIRSKEFPKLANTQGNGLKKAISRTKSRVQKGGGAMGSQSVTLKEIIQRKPVAIAPRVEPALPVQQPAPMPQAAQMAVGPQQLLLAAIRIAPPNEANNHHQSAILQPGDGLLPTASSSVTNATDATKLGSHRVFKYPLNSQFVSFPNGMLAQCSSLSTSTTSACVTTTAGQQLSDGQTPIFVNQLTPLGGKGMPQYILNGTALVKLTPTPVEGQDGKAGATGPQMISTSVPVVAQQQQQRSKATPTMFVSVAGQNQQIVLNAAPLQTLIPQLHTMGMACHQQQSTSVTTSRMVPLLQPQQQSLHTLTSSSISYQFTRSIVDSNGPPPLNIIGSCPERNVKPPAATAAEPHVACAKPEIKVEAAAVATTEKTATFVEHMGQLSPIRRTITVPVPPDLVSPKSLVLEKIQMKSLIQAKGVVVGKDGGDLSIQISTECLDVAKRQLGVLVSPPESAKSPILSQPKTIRFPRRSDDNGCIRKGARKSAGGQITGNCYWEGCEVKCENSSKLLDHLQNQHVNPQKGPFSCHWSGCRVNGRESCSRRWLEGHVLSHGGSKTFKCIFDGCGQRFSSQHALEKHVNIHLNSSEKDGQCVNRKSVDGATGSKNKNRSTRKMRYRRQPWSARMFDFFDSGIMEGLQHRLCVSSKIAVDGALQLRGKELCRRRLSNGDVEIYAEWYPQDIISNEWINITKASADIVSINPLMKSVPITKLRATEKIALQRHLRKSYCVTSSDRKRKESGRMVVACKEHREPFLLNGLVKQEPDMMDDNDSGKGTVTPSSELYLSSSMSSLTDEKSVKHQQQQQLLSVPCTIKSETTFMLPQLLSKLAKCSGSGALNGSNNMRTRDKDSSSGGSSRYQSRKNKGWQEALMLPANNTNNNNNNHCQKSNQFMGVVSPPTTKLIENANTNCNYKLDGRT